MAKEAQAPAKASGENIERFGYKQELRRGMGLWDVVLYGVLFMVIIAPQSIFGTIQQNSHGMTPLVYIIGFVAILFTAMSYMRMSKRFPIAGSVYSYVQRGINPHVGFMAGWLILLDYILVPGLLIVMVMNWGVALIPGSPAWLWGVVFIAFNTFANIRGIQMNRGVDWVIFVVEILAVIAFIALGCTFLAGGGANGFTMDPIYQPGEVDLHFVAAGISIAALSFLGFDGMSTLAEETHEPEKNIGKGIIIALSIIIVVFVAQTYIAACVQPDWANTDPDMGFFDSVMIVGGEGFYKIMLVVNIVAVGIANIMNAQIASSRLLYSMGRQGASEVPDALGGVHLPGRCHLVLGVAPDGSHELAGRVRELRRSVVVHHVELRGVFVLLREGEAVPFGQGRAHVPGVPVDRHRHLGVRVHRLCDDDLHRGHRVAGDRPCHRRGEVEGLQRGARGVQELGGVEERTPLRLRPRRRASARHSRVLWAGAACGYLVPSAGCACAFEVKFRVEAAPFRSGVFDCEKGRFCVLRGLAGGAGARERGGRGRVAGRVGSRAAGRLANGDVCGRSTRPMPAAVR